MHRHDHNVVCTSFFCRDATPFRTFHENARRKKNSINARYSPVLSWNSVIVRMLRKFRYAEFHSLWTQLLKYILTATSQTPRIRWWDRQEPRVWCKRPAIWSRSDVEPLLVADILTISLPIRRHTRFPLMFSPRQLWILGFLLCRSL